ncbi:MAG: IS21 family transposase, partial [bacterium]|nr:IS21 family transposase [bacterium]
MAKKKRAKELSMRKVREIFRLSMKCGVNNREIGRSCSISHTVVNNYLKKVKEAGLAFEEIDKMSDEELKIKLRNIAVSSPGIQAVPDWEFVHQELKKKSVTQELLWQEYRDLYPDGYARSQYYKLYARWKKRLNVSLRQSHKAGEKLFVDYA